MTKLVKSKSEKQKPPKKMTQEEFLEQSRKNSEAIAKANLK